MAHVANEDSQFDEIARIAADRLQSHTQVSENLIGLRCKIIPSDQRTIAIKGSLTGDKDYAAGPHIHDL
jgi:hypothetical protein